jgi:hypothetical protein
MVRHFRSRLLTALAACFLLHPHTTLADQIPVHYQEGVKHGFLSLRSVEGKPLADGELAQTAQGDRVTDVLTFRFKDGSVYEETTVFSQRGSFRLLTDHVSQKGPTFAHPMETSVDTATGEVTVRTKGDNGKEEAFDERMNLPADVANGLFFVLLKNIPANSAEATVSLVSQGTIRDKALHYTMQIRIGGVAGWFAALAGRKLADLQGWVLRGQAPELVKFEGQFYTDGPVWEIQMSAPEISAREP